MGWLRSCRAAFVEGIDVLYGGNTLHVRCLSLEVGLSHYLPVQYLSRVTTIRWTMGFGAAQIFRCPGDIEGGDQLMLLQRLLRAMPASMPSLRWLYLGFGSDISFWDESVEHFKRRFQLYTRDVLPLLDQMARDPDMSKIDVEVGLPMSVFEPHFTIGRESGLMVQYPPKLSSTDELPAGRPCFRRRLWRPVVKVAEEGPAQTERYSVMALTSSYGVRCGYWISASDNDLPLHFCSEYPHLKLGGNGPEFVPAFEEAWNSPCDEVVTCRNFDDCKCW